MSVNTLRFTVNDIDKYDLSNDPDDSWGHRMNQQAQIREAVVAYDSYATEPSKAFQVHIVDHHGKPRYAGHLRHSRGLEILKSYCDLINAQHSHNFPATAIMIPGAYDRLRPKVFDEVIVEMDISL